MPPVVRGSIPPGPRPSIAPGGTTPRPPGVSARGRAVPKPPEGDSLRPILGALLVLSVLGSGAFFGYRRYRENKRGLVGAACTLDDGCVAGAVCLGGPNAPPVAAGATGRCWKTCAADAPCASDQSCRNGVCLPLRALGESCDESVACSDGASCVSIGEAPARCLHACISECPTAGYVCQQVAVADPRGTHMEGHCVPETELRE